tara:strand:- start:294 stop:647 length:354 start_codon:yes stop_codon:yes gene_type:complete
MLATALVVALENPSLHEFGAEVQEPKKIVLKIEDVRYDIGKVNKFETTKWCFYFGRGCGRPTPPPEHPRPDRPCQADKPHCKPDGPVASVPEPSTLLLLLAGFVALFAARHFQKKSN